MACLRIPAHFLISAGPGVRLLSRRVFGDGKRHDHIEKGYCDTLYSPSSSQLWSFCCGIVDGLCIKSISFLNPSLKEHCPRFGHASIRPSENGPPNTVPSYCVLQLSPAFIRLVFHGSSGTSYNLEGLDLLARVLGNVQVTRGLFSRYSCSFKAHVLLRRAEEALESRCCDS